MALRDLLEVYGALDEAVAQSDDPSIAKSLDAFLPNASANPGWYRELESYFFGTNARQEPSSMMLSPGSQTTPGRAIG